MIPAAIDTRSLMITGCCLLTTLCCCLLSTCSSSQSQELDSVLSLSVTPQVTGVDGVGAVLPNPVDIAGLLPVVKESAYDPMTFAAQGIDYFIALPNQNITDDPGNNAVEFHTTWDNSNQSPSDLAYCMYEFVTAADYDRGAEIRYGWVNPPGDFNSAWLGVANWERNRWDWFPVSESGVTYMSSLDPYYKSGYQMFATMVLVGDPGAALKYIHLGSNMVDAVLTASSEHGLAPFTVTGYSGASTTEVGTLEKYEWDWDNDGVYEEDTGNIASAPHTYTAVGEHTISVRVTNSYGEQDTASATVEAIAPWAHTWGVDSNQFLHDSAFDSEGNCYSVGYINNTPIETDILIMKHDINGGFLWARKWGGASSDEGMGIAVTDDAIYTCGYTRSFGFGGEDVLLQCWSTDGALVWTKTWGSIYMDKANQIAYSDSALYVCGYAEEAGAPDVHKDALTMKYDTDGNVLWAYSIGGLGDDVFEDLVAIRHYLPSSTTIHLCGVNRSNPIDEDRAWYAKYGEDGTLVRENRYSGTAATIGRCLSVYGDISTEVYIGGSNDTKAFWVELTSGVAEGKSWGWGNERITGIMRFDDHLLFCGFTDAYSSSYDGFLLNVSKTGAVQAVEIWDTDNVNDRFTSMCKFPGSGILITGSSIHAAGAWTPATASPGSVTGTWSDSFYANFEAIGDVGTPTATPFIITNGTIDTGAGGLEALVIARPTL